MNRTKMKTVLFIIVTIYSVAGLVIPKGRIIGGEVASETDFPYVVSITENDRHFCGGWIYSGLWVVTTASCVYGKAASALKVVAGQVFLIYVELVEQTISVDVIYINDRYNSTTYENDIALLKLTRCIVFDNNNIINDAIAFPLAVNSVYYDVESPWISNTGTVIGWGAYSEGGFESTRLRFGVVTMTVYGEPCGDYDAEFVPLTMICAAGTSGSPCQYDEGSPLVQIGVTGQHAVIGMVSKIANCSADAVAIYTRVSAFYSWLVRTAGHQPPPLFEADAPLRNTN